MKKALHMIASQFFSLTTDKYVIFFDVFCLRLYAISNLLFNFAPEKHKRIF